MTARSGRRRLEELDAQETPIGLVSLRNRSLSPAAQRMVALLRTEIEAAGLGALV